MEIKFVGVICLIGLLISDLAFVAIEPLQQSQNSIPLTVGQDIQQKPDQRDIILDFTAPIVKDNQDYLNIHIKEVNSHIMSPGKPILPFHTILLTFPLGTKIISVDFSPNDIKTIKINKKINPAPQPLLMDSTGTFFSKENAAIYQSKDPYPSQWFSYRAGSGIYHENRALFLSIQLFPVRYLPLVDLLQYATQGNLIITYQEPPSPLISNDEWDLLMLAPSEFSSNLQPLVDHKNSINMKTKLVTLEEIPLKGRDEQESIKYFIKEAIETWGIRYVLIVGGNEKFPLRYTNVVYAEDNTIKDDEVFVSDLYYADIYDSAGEFSSWDSNNNGIFGEYNNMNEGITDIVDLYPDVYLGRFACIDSAEVDIVVNKTIMYETSKAYGEPWFTNIIVCGGDTVTQANGDESEVNEGEYVNQCVLDLLDGFSGIQIWASNNKLLNSQNINAAIEEGAGFVGFSGHGSPTSWVTHPHNEENRWIPTGGYRSRTIDSLQNGGKLPIVVIGACSCSKFNEMEDCLGWQFVQHSTGGAIATFGAAALEWGSYGDEDQDGIPDCAQYIGGLIEIKTFQAYAEGAITFGEMWGKALIEYINKFGSTMEALDYKTVEEWQPLGDPSLAISSPSLSPGKPTLEGPASGKVGTAYNYSTSSIDPDEDMLFYWFEWGDGTHTGWIGPYNSSVIVEASHIWNEQGDYEIKVKAKDEHGAQSVWSDPLPVNMPKNRIITINQLILQFLENHPHLFPTLRSLLNLN